MVRRKTRRRPYTMAIAASSYIIYHVLYTIDYTLYMEYIPQTLYHIRIPLWKLQDPYVYVEGAPLGCQALPAKRGILMLG